jgi:hypothetical protein
LKYSTSGKLSEIYTIPSVIEEPLGGLQFDVDGKLMIEKSDMFERKKFSRFFEIGESGYEYKQNNYIGFQSRDGTEYFQYQERQSWRKEVGVIHVLDREGALKRKIMLKFPETHAHGDRYVYFRGLDDEKNIYLDVGYKSLKKEGWEELMWKYSKGGKLLASIDIAAPIEINGKIPLDYTRIFVPYRITGEGDIYRMFPLKDAVRIVKYTPSTRRL